MLVGGTGGDAIDGGTGRDLVFGDNVRLDRSHDLRQLHQPALPAAAQRPALQHRHLHRRQRAGEGHFADLVDLVLGANDAVWRLDPAGATAWDDFR